MFAGRKLRISHYCLIIICTFNSSSRSIFTTPCQRLTTAATLKCGLWHKTAEAKMDSLAPLLVTPERVLSEYNENLIFYFKVIQYRHYNYYFSQLW